VTRRLAARRGPALLLALVAVFMLAWPVLAHADLVSSVPAAGSTVPARLGDLTLTFSEPLGAGSGVVIFAEQFQTVAGVTSTIDGPVLSAAIAPPLEQGTYTVQWTAVSTDGHPVEGSYQFAVSAPAFGAGLGPRIAFLSSLIFGTLALAVVALLAVFRRRR
jgi:methionine-rich copper-binding protein CopC